jgi:ribulose-phosphate 3-epimerase
MSLIVPAILPKSRADLEGKLMLMEGLAPEVQVDTVDGRFAHPETWPYLHSAWHEDAFYEEGCLPHLASFSFEADLMVEDAAPAAGKWIDAGATRIVFHATSSPHVLDDIKKVQVRYGHEKSFAPGLLTFGLALTSASDLALLPPFLPYIDFVQFMGIAKVGRQGEPFDRKVLEKIRQCRRLYPKLAIQVDGGVSLESAPALIALGVSRLVVGSALWKALDPRAAYSQLAELRTQYGRYE